MSPRPSSTPEARKAQGQMACAVARYGPDDPRTRAARDNWRGESYLAAVAAAVAEAPPLSTDQRDRLAVLLRPAAALAELRTDRNAEPAAVAS